MDYITVPPPSWDTAKPHDWAKEAERARAMARYAMVYAPGLERMFWAWASAWEDRREGYDMAREQSGAMACAAVRASVEGRADDAAAYFASAKRAAEAADAFRMLTYPSYYETIPNREE